MKTRLFLVLLIGSFMTLSLFGQPLLEENFEQWLPDNWSLYQLVGGTESNWQQGTGGFVGENCAFHDDINADHDSWLVTPMIELPVDETIELSFYERNAFMATYYDYAGVMISTNSGDPADGDFIELYESDQALTSWTLKTIDLSAYAGEDIYIAFNYVGVYAFEWKIDNVMVRVVSPYPLPAVLVSPLNEAENVALTQSLNWTAGIGAEPTGYTINFGTDNPPTNIENETDLGLVTTYDPELQYSTEYFWQIIPYNDLGEPEVDCPVWSFSTVDDPTIFPPHLETFTGDVFPPMNWGLYAGLLGENTELVADEFGYWQHKEFANLGNVNNSAAINLYSTRNYWLITPPYDLGEGGYQLQFDIALTLWNNNTATDFGATDYFAVVVSLDGGATWSSDNVIFEKTPEDDVSNEGDACLVNIAEIQGVVRFGFYAARETGTDPDIDFFVSNVRVRELATGPEVSVTPAEWDFGTVVYDNPYSKSFTVANTGIDFLNVSAITIDGSEFYTLSDLPDVFPVELGEYEHFSFTVNYEPTVVGEHAAIVTIENDVENYDLNLSAVAVDPTVTEFPWMEGFEGEVFPPLGWQNIDADEDGIPWLHGVQAELEPQEGEKCAISLSWSNVPLTPDNWLITPAIVLPEADYQLSYWVGAFDVNYYEEHYSVLISTTGTEIEDFTAILSQTLESIDWVNIILNLNDYAGETIYLAFRHHDVTDQNLIKLDNIVVEETPVSVEDELSVALVTRLNKNYPNPFNPVTSISFSLKETSEVKLEIFNVKGQKVKTLLNNDLSAGEHTIKWNGRNDNNSEVGSGVYFYRLTTPDFSASKKMMLLK